MKKADWYELLEFGGLEIDSYIVKYTMGKRDGDSYKATDYHLLRPMNGYTIYPRVERM